MSTTLEKFEYASNDLDILLHVVNRCCEGKTYYPLLEKTMQQAAVLESIMQDYAEDLEEESDHAKCRLLCAQAKLDGVLAEEKENKRVAKVRKRKTSKGMSKDDFALWAKGRVIKHKAREVKYINRGYNKVTGESYVYGSGIKQNGWGCVHVDLSLIWRIVESENT